GRGPTAGGGGTVARAPPRGVSRRRLTPERALALARAVDAGDEAAIAVARLDLHGALPEDTRWRLAPDVDTALRKQAVALVAAHHAAHPESAGLPLASARAELALASRRRVTLGRAAGDAVA